MTQLERIAGYTQYRQSESRYASVRNKCQCIPLAIWFGHKGAGSTLGGGTSTAPSPTEEDASRADADNGTNAVSRIETRAHHRSKTMSASTFPHLKYRTRSQTCRLKNMTRLGTSVNGSGLGILDGKTSGYFRFISGYVLTSDVGNWYRGPKPLSQVSIGISIPVGIVLPV